MSIRDRIFVAIPVIVLSLIACNQIRLAYTLQVSPWKGGGFGMFASTDGGINRHIRAFVTSKERYEEVRFPRALSDQYLRAKTLPSDKMLLRLSDELGAHGEFQDMSIREIRLEVWRVVFDQQSMLPVKEKLAELTVLYESVP